MRGRINAVSWLVLAAALSAAPAYAQQAKPSQPTDPSPKRVVIADLLKPDALVTVYGDRQATDPGSYAVIDAQKIEDMEANHPAEILNTVPGVNVQMNSGQELLIAIRSPVLPAGAGQGSFLILENGVPIRASGFGNVNALFELHHETAEDIEVVRGPGSVRYGSNAVHGLINIIDPEPGRIPGWKLDMSGNTLQRFRADGVENIATGDGGGYLAALSVMGDHGWRDASSVDQQKLTLRALNVGADWRVTTTLNAVNLNQETAGFIVGADAYKNEDTAKTNPNPEAYRDAWVARLDSRIEKQIGGNLLTITPFAITQRMIFIQHFLPDQSTEKNGHDSGGVLVRYDFGPDAVRWSVGADVQYADGKLKEIQTQPSFGGTPTNRTFPQGIHYDYDVETWMAAVYGELNWEFAKDWRMLGGLRLENNTYDYTTFKAPGVYGRYRIAPSRTDDYNLATPKLGLIYSGFDWGSLYANYAKGQRAPQVSDQYRLQNLQTIERLKVETLDSFEAGARGTIAGVSYDVAAYTMKKEHFFFRDADGLNVPNGKTDHVGVEAALSGQFGEMAGGRFEWGGNVSWSDQTYAFNRDVTAGAGAEDVVDGNKIDTAPEWLADVSLGWRSPKFFLGLSAEYVGEYFTDAANLHSYPGHLIAHLRGSWNFSDHLQAYAIVRNITDERYADRADFASGQDRYFPGEPVNLTLGVRVRG